MRKINLLLLALVAISFTLVQCEDDKKSVNGTETITINATSKSQWVYFSFEKDTIVSITDSLNSTDWDIAFNRVYIKTNSGKSGKGNGGVYNSGKSELAGFNEITAPADTATFQVDDYVNIYGYNPANPAVPTVERKILSPVLTNWYKREDTQAGSVIITLNNIYVLKTAKGKYAKFYITNYYNSDNKSGYYTIKYLYQPDGSKNLQ